MGTSLAVGQLDPLYLIWLSRTSLHLVRLCEEQVLSVVVRQQNELS